MKVAKADQGVAAKLLRELLELNDVVIVPASTEDDLALVYVGTTGEDCIPMLEERFSLTFGPSTTHSGLQFAYFVGPAEKAYEALR